MQQYFIATWNVATERNSCSIKDFKQQGLELSQDEDAGLFVGCQPANWDPIWWWSPTSACKEFLLPHEAQLGQCPLHQPSVLHTPSWHQCSTQHLCCALLNDKGCHWITDPADIPLIQELVKQVLEPDHLLLVLCWPGASQVMLIVNVDSAFYSVLCCSSEVLSGNGQFLLLQEAWNVKRAVGLNCNLLSQSSLSPRSRFSSSRVVRGRHHDTGSVFCSGGCESWCPATQRWGSCVHSATAPALWPRVTEIPPIQCPENKTLAHTGQCVHDCQTHEKRHALSK